jgi:hypothetical protein
MDELFRGLKYRLSLDDIYSDGRWKNSNLIVTKTIPKQ